MFSPVDGSISSEERGTVIAIRDQQRREGDRELTDAERATLKSFGVSFVESVDAELDRERRIIQVRRVEARG